MATAKRIRTENIGGVEVYSVSGWPGWVDVCNTCSMYLICSIVLVVIMSISRMLLNFTNELTPYGYFNRGVALVIGNIGDMSIILALGTAIILLPVVLVYQLSPKRFWIENDCLCYEAKLLGLIKRKSKIPFGRILEIKMSGGGPEGKYVYHLSVHYERKLPKLLFIILVNLNEKFSQWFLLLANGLEKDEAEEMQMKLLAPMTSKA